MVQQLNCIVNNILNNNLGGWSSNAMMEMSEILNCAIFLSRPASGTDDQYPPVYLRLQHLCLTHTQNQAHKHFLTAAEALENRNEIGATAIHGCRGREIMLSTKHHAQYTM